ncbi:alpha/beta fold hydrolase [Candidatus Palauibacter sp.]|uniref:alpha/beta fold hydrolase n=1 Tax=Candidatus Palauibacter sp. TaxID=3101350 RepID=UPI003B5BED76
MPRPQLHQYTVAGAGAQRWLYVLNGIYGTGRNWASFARRLVAGRPEWGAVLVDLRLHGHSRGFEPPHTLAACVHDLLGLSAALERPVDAEGFASHVARWLATNLVLGDGGYRWRFDPDEIEKLLADYFRRDLWDVIETPVPSSEIHIVRADQSDILSTIPTASSPWSATISDSRDRPEDSATRLRTTFRESAPPAQ